MKKNTFLAVCVTAICLLCFVSPSAAQLESPVKEYGFQFDVMDGISHNSFFFKKEKGNDRFRRIRARFSSGTGYLDQPEKIYQSYRSSLSWGLEKRLPLWKESRFYYGFEITTLADWSRGQFGTSEKEKSLMLAPGIGVPLGVVFHLSEKWNLNLETIPGLFFERVVFDDTSFGRLDEAGGVTMDIQGFYLGFSLLFGK